MLKKVILIHGVGGIGKEKYFPATKKFLENLGLEVFMPSLGGYKENTSYESWSDFFDKNLKHKFGKDTIVIAQSIGTQFLIKYLSKTNLELGLYISCCGPRFMQACFGENNLRDKVSTSFIPSDEEFETFKNLNFPKHSFYSDNDTFFNLENLESYADAIGAEKHLCLNRAHFNFDGAEGGVAELENFLKAQILGM